VRRAQSSTTAEAPVSDHALQEVHAGAASFIGAGAITLIT
jgi:hypothetical protein